MRGLGIFFGRSTRNDPIKLVDPHPIKEYGDDVCTGNAGRDGFTVLSRARADAQGIAPPVNGVVGQSYQGPSSDWEQ
jgi:hypothetical protein